MGDIQTIVLWALGIAFSILGWICRSLYDAVEKLKDDVAELPKIYILKDDYKSDIAEIKGMLGQIYTKLDAKVNKEDLK